MFHGRIYKIILTYDLPGKQSAQMKKIIGANERKNRCKCNADRHKCKNAVLGVRGDARWVYLAHGLFLPHNKSSTGQIIINNIIMIFLNSNRNKFL